MGPLLILSGYNLITMPTVSENMQYVYQTAFHGQRNRVLHYVVRLVIICLIAVLAEVVVFNFNAISSIGYKTVNLNGHIQLPQDDEENYLLSESSNVLEFKDLNKRVDNIFIGFDPSQSAQLLDVKINFTDAAHKTYFDSTEYTAGVPIAEISTGIIKSQYVNLNSSGEIGSLRIEVVGDEWTSYPIKISEVSINKPRPFQFRLERVMGLLALMLLGYALRPGSSLYHVKINEHPRFSKAVVVVTVLIETFLISGYLLFGSNLVGVATERYNYGSWDGISVANTFEVGGDNAQQYAELAKSMAEGHFYLDEQPPQWLVDMDDPYDKGARDQLQKQSGDDYLFDVAYFDGHYYVYFGVVPCIMFYLPFYLLTGANFPTAMGVLFALIAFIVGVAALLDRFARYHFKRVNMGLYLLLQIPLVMCSGILYLAKFPTFYSLPIACALAFSVWGMYFWIKGRASEKPIPWYLAGSLCMALVAGCRPQLLVFSLIAFPLFWRKYVTEKRMFTKRGFIEFLCLIAPYLVVAAGIMGYNHARFGSFTDFGANYNLTVNDMTKRGMNVGRLAPALFAYFFQTPNVTGVFPFLQPVMFDTTYMGQTIKEVTFGGIFACLPVLWLLPFAPRILKLRIASRNTRTVAGVIMVLLFSGVLVALLDAEMAGILQRYYADFSFMFLASVVLLVFIVNENMEDGLLSKQLLTKVLLVLVAVSVSYNLLLCFVPETGWYSNVYSWAYQDVLEMFLFWK